MKSKINRQSTFVEESLIRKNPQGEATHLLLMAEGLAAGELEDYPGLKEEKQPGLEGFDEEWQAEYWRQISTGALTRFQKQIFPRLESLQTEFGAKVSGITILADWVEADIIAYQLEKTHVEILAQEERRFREMLNRLPMLTEKLLKICTEIMKRTRRRDVTQLLAKMLNQLVTRCPVVPNNSFALKVSRSEFNDVLRMICQDRPPLEQVMELARDSYVIAREHNYEVIYYLTNGIIELTHLLARFVGDNVLPILDFLQRQRRNSRTAWRETCADLLGELSDYISILGIKTMPVSTGQLFDPERHDPANGSGGEAMQVVVAKVIMSGYEIDLGCHGTGQPVVRRALVETKSHREVSEIES